MTILASAEVAGGPDRWALPETSPWKRCLLPTGRGRWAQLSAPRSSVWATETTRGALVRPSHRRQQVALATLTASSACGPLTSPAGPPRHGGTGLQGSAPIPQTPRAPSCCRLALTARYACLRSPDHHLGTSVI
ncbi:hypothetical protein CAUPRSCDRAFT_10328 [Caulochytrium protostelioides]|uniref:Uncharacterized protein n=1 Tax=Caulochytrium protostelioides TaxID=1555241 RepID=A0A4P9WXC1_9FUNG|nr:hypothetical protein CAUPRSCDRAFT_10328 [Caulochytrium protostelioides]